MPSFIDAEFGEIIIHKRRGSRAVHIRLGTSGRLVATVPFFTPIIAVKQAVKGSREQLRIMIRQVAPPDQYRDGQAVGKSHTLAVVQTGMVKEPTTKIQRNTLLVYLPPNATLEGNETQQCIRDAVITILRREAKATLPAWLERLATAHGFSYERIRFSHAAGRWGSCTSGGTISLNIALMKLPDELIEYVLIHELCHTREMNHSPAFWREVERYDPHFRLHKRQIKRQTPSV